MSSVAVPTLYPSSLAASTSTTHSEVYPSLPLPSPGSSTVSRWRNVFKLNKSTPTVVKAKDVGPSSINDGSLDPGEGISHTESPEQSQSSSPHPVRVAQIRSQTEPYPLTIIPNRGEFIGKGDEAEDGRPQSSGSSYHVHPGAHVAPSLQPVPPAASTSASGELKRAYSVHTDTDRSSHSSSSRHHASSTTGTSISPNTNRQTSSASLTIENSVPPNTPLRSPGLGMSGLKNRFFSSSSATTVDNARPTRSKGDEYKGLGKSEGDINDTDRQISGGSTSLSSKPASSPRTPGRSKRDPSSSSSRFVTPPEAAQSRGSVTRFLRRVVSAPNTKALFSPNFHNDAPAVPPLPSNTESLTGNSTPHEIDLSASPPHDVVPISAVASPFDPPNPLSASTASLPVRSPHSSPLNPSGVTANGTRAARSLTAGAASQPKNSRAMLGVGSPKEPHHKQVFRRTYSTNSIKTRSVRLRGTSSTMLTSR